MINWEISWYCFFALLLTKLKKKVVFNKRLIFSSKPSHQISNLFLNNVLSNIWYENCKEIANKIFFFLISNKCRGALTWRKSEVSSGIITVWASSILSAKFLNKAAILCDRKVLCRLFLQVLLREKIWGIWKKVGGGVGEKWQNIGEKYNHDSWDKYSLIKLLSAWAV